MLLKDLIIKQYTQLKTEKLGMTWRFMSNLLVMGPLYQLKYTRLTMLVSSECAAIRGIGAIQRWENTKL